MNAFRRLSRFGSIVAERAAPAQPQFARLLQWLWRRRRPVLVAILGVPLLYLGLQRHGQQVWSAYKSDPDTFTPFFTPIAALLAGLAAFGQWRTARLRHEEQTNADRRRRITETYSKAVTQLASDKLEERLGGIYTLESISKESLDDYWTVMETLTAFVRERSRRNEAERAAHDGEQQVSRRAYFLWQQAGQPEGQDDDFWTLAVRFHSFGESPATDIAAVLTVITRRSERSREREVTNNWRLDLSGAVLNQADLRAVHLERANLRGAHLVKADLRSAHLEGADLREAHFEWADLALVEDTPETHPQADAAFWSGDVQES